MSMMRTTLICQIMITTQIQIERQKAQTDRILFRQTTATDHYSPTTDNGDRSLFTGDRSLFTDMHEQLPDKSITVQINTDRSRKMFQQNIIRTKILTDRKDTVHQHAYPDRYRQIDFYCSRFYRQIPTDRLLLFKIDFIDFYYSRFYRQINLSSLHLTQVTFEDLPWFTLSINKTDFEDRRQVQV